MCKDIFNREADNNKKKLFKLVPKSLTVQRHNLGKIYYKFALNFISVVVRKKKFENYCIRFPFSQYVTVSDEAFALLIFENNYDRWTSMAINDQWTSSSIKPAYTSGGNVNQTTKPTIASNSKKYKKNTIEKSVASTAVVNNEVPTTSKFQGWSIVGIRRFNELYDLIATERNLESGKEFETDFLTYCIAEKNQNWKKRRRRKNYL